MSADNDNPRIPQVRRHRLAGVDLGPGEHTPSTELTPIGEQYVIPGCERDATRGPKQGSLWE